MLAIKLFNALHSIIPLQVEAKLAASGNSALGTINRSKSPGGARSKSPKSGGVPTVKLVSFVALIPYTLSLSVCKTVTKGLLRIR